MANVMPDNKEDRKQLTYDDYVKDVVPTLTIDDFVIFDDRPALNTILACNTDGKLLIVNLNMENKDYVYSTLKLVEGDKMNRDALRHVILCHTLMDKEKLFEQCLKDHLAQIKQEYGEE